jgi:3-deoxy-7-phosphoheptulonate synthase
MILHLKQSISQEEAAVLAESVKAFHIFSNNTHVLITGSGMKEVPAAIESKVDNFWVFPNDMQLAAKSYLPAKREVKIGNVESEDQIRESAQLLVNLGLTTLRGGCYKPRTSPYSFQGMGLDGLKLLAKMRDEFGLTVITEARDATHIDEIIAYSDVIQVGAKAMYDQGILRACAKTQKPVLIKRGFGTTLQEFAQAAEFVLSGGNENVVLCERGIRTFETGTRFTLDLCGVAWLQEYTNLPIILDPSHAMGYAYGVPALAKACVAMGIDGLLIETHRDPKVAKSDASQQLDHQGFENLLNALKPVAESVGYKMI